MPFYEKEKLREMCYLLIKTTGLNFQRIGREDILYNYFCNTYKCNSLKFVKIS